MANIREAFTLFGRMVRILWDELLTFVVCNALWFLLCCPIVTAPAASAALYYVADLAARDRPVRVGDFFEGFKQYILKGSLLGVLNLFIAVVIAANILFYGRLGARWAQFVQALWLAVALFWLIVQVYVWPLLAAQVKPNVLMALRNAVMLTLAQPVFTIMIALEVGAMFIVSVILMMPLMIIGMSAVALLSCMALHNRVNVLRIRQGPPPTVQSE